MTARKYWVGMNIVPAIGPAKVRALLDCFGDLETAWRADAGALKQAGMDRTAIRNLVKLREQIDLDGEMMVFMDEEDYTQYSMNLSDLEQERLYITEGMEGIVGLIVDDQLLGIELPQSVVMTITDTAPALKGATATGRTKPAAP